MGNMIELLRAFEYRIWEAHRNSMPNVRLRQCVSSFVVHYEFGDDIDIESVFLHATKDGLCVKVFHGKDPECEANILYATPVIFQISKAESMLNFIVKTIDESTYTEYDVDIECVAQAIKKEYDA